MLTYILICNKRKRTCTVYNSTGGNNIYYNICKKTYQFKAVCKDDVMISVL